MVVAARPSSSPAAASANAPTHTEATRAPRSAARRSARTTAAEVSRGSQRPISGPSTVRIRRCRQLLRRRWRLRRLHPGRQRSRTGSLRSCWPARASAASGVTETSACRSASGSSSATAITDAGSRSRSTSDLPESISAPERRRRYASGSTERAGVYWRARPAVGWASGPRSRSVAARRRVRGSSWS